MNVVKEAPEVASGISALSGRRLNWDGVSELEYCLAKIIEGLYVWHSL